MILSAHLQSNRVENVFSLMHVWVLLFAPGIVPVATHHPSPQGFGCFSTAFIIMVQWTWISVLVRDLLLLEQYFAAWCTPAHGVDVWPGCSLRLWTKSVTCIDPKWVCTTTKEAILSFSSPSPAAPFHLSLYMGFSLHVLETKQIRDEMCLKANLAKRIRFE